MTKVVLTGWNVGFKKVSFNKFIQDKCDLGLKDAHAVVCRVLDNERVEVQFERLSSVDEQRMTELGVKFEIAPAAQG